MGVMTVAVTVARHEACFLKPSRACSSNYHNNFDEREHSNPRNQLAAWKPHVASTGLLVPCHATPKAFQIILYTKLLAVNWRSALCCLSKFTARSGLESTASANKAVRWGHVYPHNQPLTYPCEQACRCSTAFASRGARGRNTYRSIPKFWTHGSVCCACAKGLACRASPSRARRGHRKHNFFNGSKTQVPSGNITLPWN